jgi:hypothetical protein
MTKIVGVIDDKDYQEALKELEDLKLAKRQRDNIYDFVAERGFDTPGMVDTVVIRELHNADADVRMLKQRLEWSEERATHLGNQINQLSKFLAKRGWDLPHGGGAVDIAIGVIRQLDDQLLHRVKEVVNDYGQELELLYPPKELRNNLTCEDVGCRCVDDPPVPVETAGCCEVPLEECADCRSGCYNCARHGGGV